MTATTLFRTWRERHGLSQQAAARALDYSLRMIGNYDRGEEPVPAVVQLAMRGYDAIKSAPVISSPADALNHLSDAEIVSEGSLTPLAEIVAALEGWGLFWNEGDAKLEIQCNDNCTTFANDAEAHRHVQQRAQAGMKLHRLALQLHEGKS